jgi:hypothetical protein
VKKTSYAPGVVDGRVPPPPQPAYEEEEDPEIQIYYDSDDTAESLEEHDPALRLTDFEDFDDDAYIDPVVESRLSQWRVWHRLEQLPPLESY